MVEKEYVGWDAAELVAIKIAEAADAIGGVDHVVGVARGGLPLAVMVSHELDVSMSSINATHYDGTERDEDVEVHTKGLAALEPGDTVLLVDDVADTGQTLEEITQMWDRYEVEYRTAVWHEKPSSEFKPNISISQTDSWIVYPWEEVRTMTTSER